MALLIRCKELNGIQPLDSPPIQTTLQSLIDPSISFPICDSIDPAALIRGALSKVVICWPCLVKWEHKYKARSLCWPQFMLWQYEIHICLLPELQGWNIGGPLGFSEKKELGGGGCWWWWCDWWWLWCCLWAPRPTNRRSDTRDACKGSLRRTPTERLLSSTLWPSTTSSTFPSLDTPS